MNVMPSCSNQKWIVSLAGLLILASSLLNDGQCSMEPSKELLVRHPVIRKKIPEAQLAAWKSRRATGQITTKPDEGKGEQGAASSQPGQNPSTPPATTSASSPQPSQTTSALPVQAPSASSESVGASQSGVASQSGAASAAAAGPAQLIEKEGRFSYVAAGKIDPFRSPFDVLDETRPLDEKRATKKKEKRLPLTPLQQISTEELKLVGILVQSKGNKALVEGPAGKSYILSEGTPVGDKFGKVSQILRDRVVVKEEVEDWVTGETEMKSVEIGFPKKAGGLQ